MKSTAIAPSNIAFVKYWGRKDEELKLPANGSISMNLSGLTTTTTVEFSSEYTEDDITIYSSSEERSDESRSSKRAIKQYSNGFESSRLTSFARTIKNDPKVIAHLDRIRKLAGISDKAKVVSENSFPRGTGLSSSASGFAALTVAATKAAGLDLSEKELSILARQGSGSACRSIPDGFVEWLDGDTSDTSYAVSLYPPEHWDIVDIAVVLTDQVKDVSTTEGQKLAHTSPFFSIRQEKIKNKIAKIKDYLKTKKFQAFGELVEAEALEMHAIMLTSHPSLIYWYPATIILMKQVKQWRMTSIHVYWSVNTGQNIHLICQKKDAEKVTQLVKQLPEVKQVIINYPANGARVANQHLF
ncbi:MAG: diphosphomevalonate decarboxylase [Candidatus Levybacteria bacterium]|nr:diphosphomevalonate decarboxylase [Candidatus Levybacteria bacterium]